MKQKANGQQQQQNSKAKDKKKRFLCGFKPLAIFWDLQIFGSVQFRV